MRVYLVDDHALFRSGVKAEVGRFVDVVGEAGSVDDAVDGILERRPDVAVVDVHLPGGGEFSTRLPLGYNAFLYPYEGSAVVGPAGKTRPLPHRAAGVLSDGDEVRVVAGAEGVRLLLLAAKPLREPVVQYGPFVMNTREEIEQALADYRDGTLALDEAREAG